MQAKIVGHLEDVETMLKQGIDIVILPTLNHRAKECAEVWFKDLKTFQQARDIKELILGFWIDEHRALGSIYTSALETFKLLKQTFNGLILV